MPEPGGEIVPLIGAGPVAPSRGLRRLVQFDLQTGEPVVKDVPIVTAKNLNDISEAALALPYSEPGDELAIEMGLPPSEFYGRPMAEVMLIKQVRNAARTGDADQVEKILDRRLGKPKTTAETTNITKSYEQVLKEIANKEVAEATPVKNVEIVADPSEIF